MNFKETTEWIFEKLPMYQRIGAAAYKANLNNTYSLMNMIDNPQNDFHCIHVAGTNGKGSCSHLLASVLQEAGYKVGLYTSPHLVDYRERMKINGKKIPKQFVVDFIEKYKNRIEEIQPSFFEITVAIALDWFHKEKTKIAIIETGMGGRLDSTNVVSPVLSVITNVGFDHTAFLGDTLDKIAAEKAGIIKYGSPVIIGEFNPHTYDVFRDKAEQLNSKIIFAQGRFFFFHDKEVKDFNTGVLLKKGKPWVRINCPLIGEYQHKNFVTVACAIDRLKKLGIYMSRTDIIKGFSKVIANTGLRGRWDIISNSPLTICDVAHNNEGLELVFNQLLKLKFDKLHIVFGVNDDKNLDSLFKILPKNAEYYFCQSSVPRAMNSEKIYQEALKYGFTAKVFNDVVSAFNEANSCANSDKDVIFVGGSTFVVAEVPGLIKSDKDEK